MNETAYQEEKSPCENKVLMYIGKKVEEREHVCSFRLLKKRQSNYKGDKE